MASPSTVERTRVRRAAQRSGSGLKYGIAFTAPFLVLYLIFVIYPVLQAVWMSFHDWDLLGATREFLGFANYERMLWGHDITWSMTHQWLPRVILLAAAIALLIRPLLRRRLSVGVGLSIVGILLIVVALGFHPAEGGFWYDPDFWVAFKNTLVFTAISTPLIAGLGLVMALTLQGNRRGARIYQMVFFLPYILPVSVVTLVWTYFLSPNQGLLAALLAPLGIDPIPWLSDPNVALIAIIATTVWWTVGFNLVLFSAGLQDVDPALYEAASLDGAGPWRKFTNITLPGIRHVLLLVMVMQVIASFQVFGQVNIMTGGGPGTSTTVLIQEIYQAGFRDFELGYGSAMSLLLFAVMLIISIIQMRTIGKEDAR